MHDTLLLLGASVRAAAYSAHRARLRPVAGDLFADADLCALCPTVKVSDYPAGLEQVAAAAPPCGWMYTGGLENYPALVDSISTSHRLYGNPGRVLRRVRDPLLVTDAFHRAGIAAPAVRSGGAPMQGGTWLKKPLDSCGGARIARVVHAEQQQAGEIQRYYFQQFIEGISCSAVFVAANGCAALLGVTEQLVGCNWSGASGFRYAGSIGPLWLSDDLRRAFQRIGNCLATQFELVGLFGVDVIHNDGGVWPVEVNPRYPSSVEVLERGLSIKAVDWHLAACHRKQFQDVATTLNPAVTCGKAVLYARRTIEVRAEISSCFFEDHGKREWPAVADVPSALTTIEQGCPVATVFAAGTDRQTVARGLRELAQRVQQQLDC